MKSFFCQHNILNDLLKVKSDLKKKNEENWYKLKLEIYGINGHNAT